MQDQRTQSQPTPAAGEEEANRGCCSPGSQRQSGALEDRKVHSLVREKYAAIATQADTTGCCGSSATRLRDLGYSAEQTRAIPQGANLGLGCGNPLAHAEIRAGETILDLGSGAGIDAFLASREVGDSGHVIGVDMTPEMLERARENARKVGARNVEFRLGEIEHLPVESNSVDLIISNCVINLAPDKQRVFREALRVLKPGGRLVVSDILLLQPLPAEVRDSVEAYVGCVAGASLRGDYLEALRNVGFEQVEVLEERVFGAEDSPLPESDVMHAVARNIVSAKIRAWKP